MSPGSASTVLFRLGFAAALANLALLTMLAASPLPLSSNPVYLVYAVIVLGVAVAGVILRRIGFVRLSAGIVASEFLPLAFWFALFIATTNGIDVLERLSPIQPSNAALRPTD